MSYKKHIILIILLASAAYAGTLRNGFIGDDHILFEDNNFYKDKHNLSRLFKKDFVTSFDDIDPALTSQKKSFSGCVAYRPVVALSFFLDSFLWKNNTAGYHFTNIFLHALTSVCVFFFIVAFAVPESLAFTAAALFAVHPIHAEVVNCIGYRSDLLSMLFYLLAFLMYIKRYTSSAPGKQLALSLFFFCLALLAKESVAPYGAGGILNIQ